LKLLGIKAKVGASEEKGEEGQALFKVALGGEDLGILIGYHGETLSSLQHFLVLAMYKEFSEWCQILLDVEGYREEQEERLKDIAQKVADRALFEGRPIHMHPMPAYERKVIHTALTKIDSVSTESEGEGRERHIIVKPQ